MLFRSLAVDVNSWARSACYPRSTFYPLSDGPSTRYHRITRPGFRLCSTSPSRSQAGFCPCTRRTISNRAEPTLGRLRYPLGGDRPSQTAHLPLSSGRLHGPKLEPSHSQGGISPSAPPTLARRVLRLPPILHRLRQTSMTGYSQGSRGLSVYSREASIFTGATISPGLSRRQRPSRYAIRAGRNLPDKEFRYLRTVIVAAAVYRGFGRELHLAINPLP